MGVYGAATAVSDDGTVVAGIDNERPYPPDETPGFVWREGLDSRRVRDLLVHDHGLDLNGPGIGAVLSMSGDGQVIAGRNYVARLTDDTLPGDVNFDDRVDLDDFAILRKGFGKGTYRDQGDTNLDRHVDLTDFGILKANLGTVRQTAVPEPSSAAFLLIGLLLLAGRPSAIRLATTPA